jgi:hypothetical protein
MVLIPFACLWVLVVKSLSWGSSQLLVYCLVIPFNLLFINSSCRRRRHSLQWNTWFFSPVDKYWEAFVLYFNFSSDDIILAHKFFAWRSQNCKDCSNLQNGHTESKLLYVNHPIPQENLCINRTMHVSIHVV